MNLSSESPESATSDGALKYTERAWNSFMADSFFKTSSEWSEFRTKVRLYEDLLKGSLLFFTDTRDRAAEEADWTFNDSNWAYLVSEERDSSWPTSHTVT